MTDSPIYWAHSANGVGRRHSLTAHLSAVSELARGFLEGDAEADTAALAGLLHDLGKYGDRFQARLRGEDKGLDHWSAGAWVALTRFRSVAAAFAVQGHHVGLQRLSDLRELAPAKLALHHPLGLSLTDPDPLRLLGRLEAGRVDPSQKPTITQAPFSQTIGSLLDIRILFSALVDADFLDTEAHFQGGAGGKRYRTPGPPLDAAKALGILQRHLAELEQGTRAAPGVADARRQLREACLVAAGGQPGLRTLTAPTGSGKTLAMLAYALAHAQAHGLSRVVVVVPYLSIIEQTAGIFRTLFEPHFGPDYVLEHHSLSGGGAEPGDRGDGQQPQEHRRRQLSENWDAPLIVTTSVQMLESLFANRPSRCRKLHRLRKAVVMFDEVQTLPADLAVPTLAALSHLSARHGTSLVFATATQPAFEHLHPAVLPQAERGWRPEEIVPDPSGLFDRLRRNRVHWGSPDAPMAAQALAVELEHSDQVLCVLNLKRQAQGIWESLGEGALHLSTNLCPAHRQAVLADVRGRLSTGEPCRLIATQCVEAGVDLDFPVVYRAYGPLEAVIQAAGRCNRNGRLERGEVRVFLPEDIGYPGRAYERASDLTRLLVRRQASAPLDLDDPALVRDYYRRLYDLGHPADAKRAAEVLEAVGEADFPRIAELYRLIEQDAINVVVPYAARLDDYRDLRDRAGDGLDRDWIRAARPLCVSIRRPGRDDPLWDGLMAVAPRGAANRRQDEWFVYLREEDYHPQLGLCPRDGMGLWIA